MANPLQIVITVDTRSGNAELDGTKRKIEDIGPAGQKAGRQASDGISAIERQARSASVSIRNEFSGVRDIIRLAFASAGASAAKSAIDISANFQLAEVGIGAFVKEGENAKKVFSDLKQFSLQSPLDFSSILKASNQLLALDTAAKDLIPTLESLSGAVFAVTAGQNTPERLNDVIIALGQIKAAGALTGEEFRQLRNANIVTIQELAEAFDVTVEQFRKAIVERTVPAAEVIPAILDKVKQRFGRFNDDIRNSAAVAFSNFRDALAQAADEAVREYLPKLVESLNNLSASVKSFATVIKENKDGIESFADLAIRLGGGIITYRALGAAINWLRGILVAGAAAINPWLLIPATLVALLPEIAEVINRIQQTISWRNILRNTGDVPRYDTFAKEIMDRASGQAAAARKAIAEELTGVFNFENSFLQGQNKKYKLSTPAGDREKELKRLADAEKRSEEVLQSARQKALDGLEAIVQKYRDLRGEIGLTAKARENLKKAEIAESGAFAADKFKRDSEDAVKAAKESLENSLAFSEKRFEKEVSINDEILQRRQEADQILLGLEEKFAERRRDSELRALAATNVTTLQGRLAIEEQRAQIETRFLEQSLTRRARAVDFEIGLEIIKNEAILRAAGVSEEKIAEMRESFQRLGLARVRALAVDVDSEIRAATENATTRQAQLIRDNNLRVFEGLKRNVEGLFDATVTRSKSFGQALADSIKIPFLAALKEIVSSRVAAFLFQLFGGGPVALRSGQPSFGGAIGATAGGGSNVLGRLLGIGGAAALGGGGGIGGIGFPGAPGGTPGFAGPVYLGGGGGVSAGTSGATSGVTGSLAGSAASLKGILSSLGNIGRGGAVLGPGSNGGALAQPGVGGAAGGAMVLGGGILAGLGLQRGGLSGLGMTIAGGALIGAKFGGLGALIGGGIGAIAGTIRLFIKGAEEKLVEKVRNVYGITISRNFARDPLLGIIKQTFGGNIDVGIRSPQVRDLIELYAMSTGQNSQGINTTRPIASSFALSGGSFTQQPVFQNGISLGLGQASNASPVIVQNYIQLDGEIVQAQSLQAISDNPRSVQGALFKANNQNAGRRKQLGLALNPMEMIS